MEHRWSVRVPVETTVAVRYPGRGRMEGRSRDMSFDGMYVETRERGTGDRAVVSLQFDVNDGGEAAAVEIPAMVVRADAGGLGVMFADYDAATFERIARLLQRPLSARFGS